MQSNHRHKLKNFLNSPKALSAEAFKTTMDLSRVVDPFMTKLGQLIDKVTDLNSKVNEQQKVIENLQNNKQTIIRANQLSSSSISIPNHQEYAHLDNEENNQSSLSPSNIPNKEHAHLDNEEANQSSLSPYNIPNKEYAHLDSEEAN